MIKQTLPHKLAVAILIFTFATDILAQDLPKVLDPPVEFEKGEIKKIDKANELINSGLEIWNKLKNVYNPKNITNFKTDSIYHAQAYPMLVDVAKKFSEADNIKYEIFHKNCVSFWNKHKYDYPSGLDGAKSLQKEAITYFEKAALNRQAALAYAKEYAKAFDKLHEAISLEIIAVKKEGRALQLYRDWPVHYNYVYDDDIVQNLFPKEKRVEVAIADVKETKDTVLKTVAEKPEPEPEPYDSTIVYYQVQIVAHTVPLNSSYLKMNVYDGDMPIETLREEGWYKYVIGRYRTFDEANRLLKKVSIPRAFVVAYKNHKRVPIKEAAEANRN